MSQKNKYFERISLLLLVVVTVAVYYQVHDFEFITRDDYAYVYGNKNIVDGFSWEGVKYAFTSGYTANWHPLTWLSLMLDCEFENKAMVCHVTNVIYHLLNTLLLYVLFRRMTGYIPVSLFIAGVFALHPMHVESVAWVSERKDVLSTFFWLLTMHAYLSYVAKPHWGRYALMTLLLCLGLMAKSMLVTLPFVLLLMDVWPLRRFGKWQDDSIGSLKKTTPIKSQPFLSCCVEKIPLFIVVFIFSVIAFVTQQTTGTVKSLSVLGFDQRLKNVIECYYIYLEKLFWPHDMAAYYPFRPFESPVRPFEMPDLLYIWILFVGLFFITVALLFLMKRFPALIIGWLWFLGTFVPVIGFVHLSTQRYADRYTYVPSIGLSFAVAWIFIYLCKKWPKLKLPSFLGGVIVLALYAQLCYQQVGTWRNERTLYQHAASVTEYNDLAHDHLGAFASQDGDFAKAVYHWELAVEYNNTKKEVMKKLGYVLVKQKQSAKALDYFKRYLDFNSEDVAVLDQVAKLYFDQQDYLKAAKYFQASLKLKPDNGRNFSNLGACYYSLKRYQEAQAAYQKALEMNPSLVEAHDNYIRLLLETKQIDKAMKQYELALLHHPNNQKFLIDYSSELINRKEYARAIQKLKTVIKLRPQNADVHNALAVAYVNTNQTQLAEQYFKSSLAIKPNADVYCNYAMYLVQLSRITDAITQYKKALVIAPKHSRAKQELRHLKSLDK